MRKAAAETHGGHGWEKHQRRNQQGSHQAHTENDGHSGEEGNGQLDAANPLACRTGESLVEGQRKNAVMEEEEKGQKCHAQNNTEPQFIGADSQNTAKHIVVDIGVFAGHGQHHQSPTRR